MFRYFPSTAAIGHPSRLAARVSKADNTASQKGWSSWWVPTSRYQPMGPDQSATPRFLIFQEENHGNSWQTIVSLHHMLVNQHTVVLLLLDFVVGESQQNSFQNVDQRGHKHMNKYKYIFICMPVYNYKYIYIYMGHDQYLVCSL